MKLLLYLMEKWDKVLCETPKLDENEVILEDWMVGIRNRGGHMKYIEKIKREISKIDAEQKRGNNRERKRWEREIGEMGEMGDGGGLV